MRFALVVLFFVALFITLRPPSPVDPAPPLAQDTTSQQLPAQPPAVPPPSPIASAPDAPPVETADEMQVVEPAIRSGEAEKAGEQRTSQHGPLTQSDVETGLQKELMRLACLSARPEKGWGSRSRSALRRFVSRAKPKEGNAPSEALLQMMRDYPANYCKLCSPGQAACRIGAQKKSAVETPPPAPPSEPAPEVSYLPPWMIQDGQLANVEDEVQTDVVAHAPPAVTAAEPARRRKRSKRVARRPRPPAFRSVQRRPNPPSLTGWPRY